jgi:hypothetical protein
LFVVFAWGFNAALLMAACIYILAFLLIRKPVGW